MKRVSFLTILLLSIVLVISCNNSDSNDVTVGYVDPGDWGGKASSSILKSYNLTMTPGATINPPAGVGIFAIIYQGNLSDIDYAGFAIDNFDNSTATSRFKLQVYWMASFIPSNVVLTNAQYTAKLLYNGVAYSVPTGNLDLSLTPQADGTYIITINGGGIPLTGITITGSMRAQKY